MSKIGLFYSFNTTKTMQAAKKIAAEFGEDAVQHVNVEKTDESEFLSFKYLILGVPTWFDGELPNYWDEFVPALKDMVLTGKTIAIFGNADQKGYPENFADAVGIMAGIVEGLGAKVTGFTKTGGYKFEKSRALRGTEFTGLILDFENNPGQIDAKIRDWVQQLKKEMH
jgi:flavodoxin I